MISSPHSPLLAGAGESRASARSRNFLVAAGNFLWTDGVVMVGFDCADCASTKGRDKRWHTRITAIANPTRTLHLWQIKFRESIVETAETLHVPPVGGCATKPGWKISAVAPRNLGT